MALGTFVDLRVGTTITQVDNYSALPLPTSVPARYYWVSNSQGVKWVGVLWGGNYYPRGLYYSNGTSWEYIETPIQATQSEVDAGLVTDKFVTPETFNAASKWTTKEDVSNKTNTIVGNETSVTLYTSVKGVVDWVTSLFVPKSRTITINGDTKDLSTNRSWTISAGVWGSITGTLSNQTDLYTVLKSEVLTVDFMNGLIVEVYAPNDLKINSVSNVVNAPTTTILVGGSPYVLGNTITVGSLIRVTVSTYSVVNLNILNL